MPAAIHIENLSKIYRKGTKALENISLDIEEGEFIGLLGPNGAGKSTLINILAGIVNRTAGSCQVLGYDVTRDFRWTRQLLGVVPQEVSFEMMMTVEETLVNQSGYFGLLNNSAKINELLETFHLSDKRKSNTRFLSGGMKRRLLVCKALVHDPRIIILDEPTAGVDVELRQELWEYIKKLNARGRTILLTTHYIDEAQALCKKIAIINHGQLIRFEEKSKLMQQIQEKKLRAVFKPGDHEFPESLKAFSHSYDAATGVLDIDFSKGQHLEILKILSSGVSALQSFSLIEPDLEDIFLKIIHGDKRA
jgi:ABC-2 type transport system ATP-binding protein